MEIYTLNSDSESTYELSDNFRNRNISQKFLYSGDGAKFYYNKGTNSLYDKKDLISKLDIYNFGIKNCFHKKNINYLISLGCGASDIENYIFSKLSNSYKIKYFGIDSSIEMLKLSIKNFENIKVYKKFICADFSKRKFRDELDELTGNSSGKIFSFFGNTFGNINHTNIIDILYGILNKGEKIWIGIALRKEKTTEENINIFNKYEQYGKMAKVNDFLLNNFLKNNIPIQNGTISRVMREEKGINSLKIEFYFTFTKKTEIDLKGKIVFLPDEKIKFHQIYYYDVESLISFFKEHHFKLSSKQIKGYRGQFLFEKE